MLDALVGGSVGGFFAAITYAGLVNYLAYRSDCRYLRPELWRKGDWCGLLSGEIDRRVTRKNYLGVGIVINSDSPKRGDDFTNSKSYPEGFIEVNLDPVEVDTEGYFRVVSISWLLAWHIDSLVSRGFLLDKDKDGRYRLTTSGYDWFFGKTLWKVFALLDVDWWMGRYRVFLYNSRRQTFWRVIQDVDRLLGSS